MAHWVFLFLFLLPLQIRWNAELAAGPCISLHSHWTWTFNHPPLISYVEFIAWCWCLHSKYVPAELNNYLGWGNKLKALHEEVQFSFPWLCCIFAYHVDAFTVSYQFDILSHQDSQIIWAQSICDRSTPAGRSWYCIYTHLMLLEYIWAVYFHYGSSRG